MKTEIRSKHGVVSKAPYELYMGFADMRNFTRMVPEDKVETVKKVLRETCAQRTQVEVMAPHATGGVAMWNMGGAPLKVTVGGATMFVLDVAEFQKL